MLKTLACKRPCGARRTRSSPTASRPPVTVRRKELVTRLQAARCELCKQTDIVEAPPMSASLPISKDRDDRSPVWDQLMAKRRRKILIVCAGCHAGIHHGQPTATPTQ